VLLRLLGKIQPVVAQQEWPVAQVAKLALATREKSFGKNRPRLRPTLNRLLGNRRHGERSRSGYHDRFRRLRYQAAQVSEQKISGCGFEHC